MKLILNPIGGLANRMRAIASGIALANDYDIEIQNILWAVNDELHATFENLFEPIPNIKLTNISNLRQLFIYDSPRKKNLFLSHLFQLNRYSGILTEENPDITQYIADLQSNKKPLLIQNGFQYYDFDEDLYRGLFIPRKDIEEKAERRIDNNTIGLHIRRTDNAVSIQQSPTELFINKIEEELKLNTDTNFYLATDSNDLKNLLQSKFGKNKIKCSEFTADRTNQSGMEEALVELLCLSKCTKLYGSYWSSYSEAAALLGNIKLQQLKK